MVLFIARRLFSMLLVTLAIVFFGYLGMNMIDNWEGEDPGYHLLEDSRAAAADSVAYLGDLLRGDLGEVPSQGNVREVTDILKTAYGNSAGLLAMALGGATLLGLLVGSLAALSRRGGREYALLLGTIVGVSMPSFLIALLLQQGGILYTRTMGTRLVSMGGYAWDFQHLAMPLVVLAARPVAYLTRAAYLALGRIMTEDYIRTAFAKGLSQTRVVLNHALRNFAVPFLTSVGVSLRFSLSTLPLVEFIFAWPGLGFHILQAIQRRVPILVVTIALAFGVTIQLVSLLLDVAYTLIDPRIGALE
jgi:peptide/nickel transport system permease protein